MRYECGKNSEVRDFLGREYRFIGCLSLKVQNSHIIFIGEEIGEVSGHVQWHEVPVWAFPRVCNGSNCDQASQARLYAAAVLQSSK